MIAKRVTYLVVVLALGLALAGCERTKIGAITADPGRFMNKEVNVVGQVTQSIGFLGTNYATVMRESDRRNGG